MSLAPGREDRVPSWVLRPLPLNALVDAKLEAKIEELAQGLPATLPKIAFHLSKVGMFAEYDSAANLANRHVWLALFRSDWSPSDLIAFANQHMTPRARSQVLRRFAKSPVSAVRRAVHDALESNPPDEIALPNSPEGEWNSTGWFYGRSPHGLMRHRQGRKVQLRHGLPPLSNVGEVCSLLGIVSPRQLGYFLLATHEDDGPYHRFTIPKRGGAEREILAPKWQLRRVQQKILHEIFDRVSPHPAAHGFVKGRSTVTNAAAHVGATVLIKFDLTDFFPTVHYFRVVGLFTSLGYTVGDGRFRTEEDSRQVAPVLARLCCHNDDPKAFGEGRLPQGAPTSPALSNLVCRTLDARLDGLARRNGGVYTRYADDLTFSFRNEVPAIGRFRWWVDQICHQEGFFLNRCKSRVIRNSQRQTVTGIVTNVALRLPRDERRAFRAILNNCRRHGVASQARGRSDFADYLRGFASYAHMVHPEEGSAWLEEVEELLGASGNTDENAEGDA